MVFVNVFFPGKGSSISLLSERTEDWEQMLRRVFQCAEEAPSGGATARPRLLQVL